ncbi:hypothetical protein KDY119_01570 [Luteimicrobium xylanilyticum]|uniref:Uncharacterized protein n=1 Tax=Luteimicrobium xylanilyticum TaxID=1133546 RepID=A0A5P9Q9E3_9MICO|nr:hypothetical protein KDY119_01570 [Luteimicrobium xylanilyticum]
MARDLDLRARPKSLSEGVCELVTRVGVMSGM